MHSSIVMLGGSVMCDVAVSGLHVIKLGNSYWQVSQMPRDERAVLFTGVDRNMQDVQFLGTSTDWFADF